jgi:hypothetical protein
MLLIWLLAIAYSSKKAMDEYCASAVLLESVNVCYNQAKYYKELLLKYKVEEIKFENISKPVSNHFNDSSNCCRYISFYYRNKLNYIIDEVKKHTDYARKWRKIGSFLMFGFFK